MNSIAIFIIRLIHIIIILLSLLVPFYGNTMLRTMYFISIPFLLVHWITNNDVCVLSIMETIVRGLDDKKDCFMCNVLEPVFKINHLSMSYLMYFTAITLWTYNCYVLWHDPLLWTMVSDIKKLRTVPLN